MFAPLRLLWIWMLALAPMLALAQAQPQFKPVPPLTAHVTDQVGMLRPEQRQELDAALADYQARTGSQIAVLLVASTEPEAIEQYSIRVTDTWKLGRKGVDDGVLLLVARDNPKALRRLRIEAGRGVQGVLTDAQSKRILQDVIAPHFRRNDWYGGLVAGTGAIEALLNQEKFPAPQDGRAAPAGQPGALEDEGSGPGVIVSIFLIVVGVLIVRSIVTPRRPRLGGPGMGGWNSGMAGFVLGNILANAARGGERWRGGGFSGGGLSDGGGFSGGGGSFDGGGASGDW
jgi:uncharacterized protein